MLTGVDAEILNYIAIAMEIFYVFIFKGILRKEKDQPQRS
jgi:hypothetical protein